MSKNASAKALEDKLPMIVKKYVAPTIAKGVAFITISFQALKAAIANPVKSQFKYKMNII